MDTATMKKVALIAAPLAVLLCLPLFAVAAISIAGSTQANSCNSTPSAPTAPGPGQAPDGTTTQGSVGGGAAVAGDPAARGGQSGTGLSLGAMPVVHNAVPGVPVHGSISIAAANLPERMRAGRPRSLRALAAAHPDFITADEMMSATPKDLARWAPGYGAYKDPVANRADKGPRMSQENVILWNTHRWHLLDGGRVMIAKDDTGYHNGHPFNWNRYLTWGVFKNAHTGAQVVIVSTHAMTNPQRFPKRSARSAYGSRIHQYVEQMNILRHAVTTLAGYGPVFVSGDMNAHPHEGAWNPGAQMAKSGFGHSVNKEVMWQFFPHGTILTGTSSINVVSDHKHALVSHINLNGAGPNDTSGTPPSGTGTVRNIASNANPATTNAATAQSATAMGSGLCQPCSTNAGGAQPVALAAAVQGNGSLHDAEVAAAAAYQAGFRGHDLYTMVWIAGGESSYNTHAGNAYTQAGVRHNVYGLWQISDIHPGVSAPGIYNPATNAKDAFTLYRGGGGSASGNGGSPGRFDAWSAHTPANEARYGPIARAAIAKLGKSGLTNTLASSNAACAVGASSPLATNIVGLATQIAWPDGRKVNCCGDAGESVSTQGYIAAKQRAMRISPDPQPDLYASCDRFVATVIKNTVDPQMPWGDSNTQHQYLSTSPKWGRRTGPLQPGDVLSTDGHILIYLGNGRVAQASYHQYTATASNEPWPPSASGEYRVPWDPRTFEAFYFKGNAAHT